MLGFKLREQDKHFLWSLWAAIGIIFVWKGVWEGIYEIPYVGDPWVILFVGFAMLTFSGLIFKEFDPLGSLDKSIRRILKQVREHLHKSEFEISYRDNIIKKDMVVKAHRIKGIEHQNLIVKHGRKNQEVFVPFHRITKVTRKGKTYWRL